MDKNSFENKRVLIVGLAKSGIAAATVLKSVGACITITDLKTKAALGELIDAVIEHVDNLILGEMPSDISEYDLIVMSPGVPMTIDLVKMAYEMAIPVIGEIELAYRLCNGYFIGITGTNGKTTTTSLTGEIFKAAEKSHFVVGNIGYPAVSKALDASKDTAMITELSSFQLESISTFKTHIAAIINITPDHLNRHKTMANYIEAKARIFENQTPEDYLILNLDDAEVAKMASQSNGRVVYFSQEKTLEEGAYIENGNFMMAWQGEKYTVAAVSDLFIPGRHNVQNALVAMTIAFLSGISKETIANTFKQFKGVAHRIAYIKEVNGRIFYNDSKGTNPDATICALEAMTRPTVLIAGGMDKKSDFTEVVKAMNGKVKALILLGETKELIRDTAEKQGLESIYLVNDMCEAVDKAYKCSAEGDAILLSPACASWDMYENFESRGTHFEACVKTLEIRWLS